MSNHTTDTAAAILADVRAQFGINFTETHTGGGCMALEARLESGHWIVATDEGLCEFRERITAESYPDNYNGHAGDDHNAAGWSIGVYPNDPAEDTWMSGDDAVVNVVDYDAYAGDLPAMVGRALAELAATR
jgi:hypothetical protein